MQTQEQMVAEMGKLNPMTEEPWNKHTPGDPMPCKCKDTLVAVRRPRGGDWVLPARHWAKITEIFGNENAEWRFVERKGEDVIAADPYDTLEWDEDGIATVVLKVPGKPEWVRDDDLVRFEHGVPFDRADEWVLTWCDALAFQIKRRPVLTPAEPQLLALLSTATDDEADAIRRAARRAHIEVPE